MFDGPFFSPKKIEFVASSLAFILDEHQEFFNLAPFSLLEMHFQLFFTIDQHSSFFESIIHLFHRFWMHLSPTSNERFSRPILYVNVQGTMLDI